MPVSDRDIIAFVPTTNPQRSRQFFETVLGLRLVSEDPFALVFDAHGIALRVASVPADGFRAAPFTILGWHVEDIRADVTALSRRGVKFERFPGLEQNDRGIWTSPGGARIAWFKDPEGNILSLTQYED